MSGPESLRGVDAVSVVIPLYNEASTVEGLLRGLSDQTAPPREIVVVDAGSTDDTAARARLVPGRCAVKLVRAARLFPGEARNEGVRRAGHDWIAFVDGGTRPEPSWLERLLVAGRESDVIFGSYEPVCDTFFRTCAALAYVPARSVLGVRGPSVASMAIRRRAFEATGGFPPYRASEDLIFIERVHERSLRVAFAPDAVVHWDIAPGVVSTFRRFAGYSHHNLVAGRGRFWHLGLARQYALLAGLMAVGVTLGLGSWTLLAVPLFFLARALKAAWVKRRSFAFATLHPGRILGAAGLLLVLDLATAAGAGRWLRAGRPREVRADQ